MRYPRFLERALAGEALGEEEKALFANPTAENRDRLILANRPLVLHVINSLSFPQNPNLDLLGEGILGLMEAVDTFRPEVGLSFKVYGSLRIRLAVLLYLKKRKRLSELAEPDALRLLKEILRGDNVSSEEMVRRASWIVSEMGQLEGLVSRVLRAIYLDNLSVEETAQALTIPDSVVIKYHRSGLRKLKRAILVSRRALRGQIQEI